MAVKNQNQPEVLAGQHWQVVRDRVVLYQDLGTSSILSRHPRRLIEIVSAERCSFFASGDSPEPGPANYYQAKLLLNGAVVGTGLIHESDFRIGSLLMAKGCLEKTSRP